MGTTLATLRPPRGATRNRKRLGRGPGTGQGTTAGRGQKGQGSRTGRNHRAGFEGGQMPLHRRLPKRGFKNPFRVEYATVNVSDLARCFAAGAEVDPAALVDRGLLSTSAAAAVKVLGDGELAHALTVRAHRFSAAARDKIVRAGGTATELGAPAAETQGGASGA